MWLEVFLSVMSDASFIADFVAVGCGLALVILTTLFFCFAPRDVDDRKQISAALAAVGTIMILSLPVALFPTAQDLWRTRVALVNYRLAGEGVGKSVEEINRVAKDLECRYLGASCPDKK